MSNILNQLISKKISLEDALHRLLVISNEIENIKLSEWCTYEIKGYSNQTELPDYRKFKSANIYLYGVWGSQHFNKVPIQPGYLSSKTMDAVSKISLFEGLTDVTKRKDLEIPPYKELNMLAPEIYKKTKEIPGNFDGLQCYSIIQEIPMELYQRVYSNVQVRVLNILSYLEKSGVNIDNCTLERALTDSENKTIYEEGILKGNPINISINGSNNIVSLKQTSQSDIKNKSWYTKLLSWLSDCWKEIVASIVASVILNYLIQFIFF